VFHIDLEHDTASVFLTALIPKSTGDVLVAEFLRLVSQAFAETEGVSTESMHAVLEKQVRGFEDATHLKFVWERSFQGKSPSYPQRLGENLVKLRAVVNPQLKRSITVTRDCALLSSTLH
jgi:hypothetical protein